MKSLEHTDNKGFDHDYTSKKILWRRKWQPTLVILPEKSRGQRSLAGYSPKGCKELDTAKQLSTHIQNSIE